MTDYTCYRCKTARATLWLESGLGAGDVSYPVCEPCAEATPNPIDFGNRGSILEVTPIEEPAR